MYCYGIYPGRADIPELRGVCHFHRGGISHSSQNTVICTSRTLPDSGDTQAGLPAGQIGYSRTGPLIPRIHYSTPLLRIPGLSPYLPYLPVTQDAIATIQQHFPTRKIIFYDLEDYSGDGWRKTVSVSLQSSPNPPLFPLFRYFCPLIYHFLDTFVR